MKWLWTQEAVQSGKFSLKKVSTDRNVSDLTTKHHHEDRLGVLMSLGRLRFARGRGDAVLAANEGQTAAVNAVRRTRRARSTELDENVLRLWGDISSLADTGGRERQRAVMVAWPRGAKISIPQVLQLGAAPSTRHKRRKYRELQLRRRRGCYND